MIEAMNESSQDSQTQSCCEGVRRPSWKERGRSFPGVDPLGLPMAFEVEPCEVNTVIQERMSLYGPPEVNLDCIARHWQAYLDNRNSGPLTLQDVCNMMCLVKISRLARTPGHQDSGKDIKAYREIAEENMPPAQTK